MSAGVLVIVWGLLLYNIIKFRAKDEDKDSVPPQTYREHTIEAIYTGIPILVVIIIFIMMLGTLNAVAAPAPKSTRLAAACHWASLVVGI